MIETYNAKLTLGIDEPALSGVVLSRYQCDVCVVPLTPDVPVRRTMFSFDNLMITLATILAVWLLSVIPQNFDFLNPIGQALGDMDMTDMVFSKFRDKDDVEADTNIVIVNIGALSRAEIAEQLRRINAQSPRVVGIDAFFRKPKDTEGDSLLAQAMSETKNLVLVSKVAFREESKEGNVDQWTTSKVDAGRGFDSLETSMPMFMQHAKTGFSNFIINQEASFMTTRDASFKEVCAGEVEPSFPIRIATIYSPASAQSALARSNDHEVINFRGDMEKFYYFDADQVLDPEVDLSVMNGKIVLLGYMGVTLAQESIEDNFFTPLNPQYVGRSHPDMYGVVVHANVLSMILHGDYINTMPKWASLVVGLMLLVINVMLFTFIYSRFENWYDTLALILQVGESILILYLIVTVFASMNYKLALTPALIGVALVGTVHDLYQDSIKKIILQASAKLRRKFASKSETQRTHTANKSTGPS